MRAPAVSFVRKIAAAAAVGLLACGLALPHVPAFAEGEDAPSALLASSLMDGSASVVREDVALAALEDDAAPEPVIGSFTVDGLTFAVTEGSNVQLVGVSPAWQQAMGLQTGEGSSQPPMPASEAEGSDADSSALLLPEAVACNGVEYSVSSIGAYAFYLSGITSVELPASVIDVDDRAFRSSDVASVEVAEGNPNYSSFDGALYDADQLSLLLIPEGKQGTVLLPKTAESAAPSVFSHCPLVTQIAVEEGSAAFASENGLLYTSDLTTLLRVPAGATEITIREGCTTIVAGAMEACVSLATINAPASVTSISPYLFEQQPETVMAPVAVAAVEDDDESSPADGSELSEAASQLSAMIALSSADDDLPETDLSSIAINLADDTDRSPWVLGRLIDDKSFDAPSSLGVLSQNDDDASAYAFSAEARISQDVALDGGQMIAPVASLMGAQTYSADYKWFRIVPNGGEAYLCYGGNDWHYPIGTVVEKDGKKLGPLYDAINIFEVGSGADFPFCYWDNTKTTYEMWFQTYDTVRFGWFDGKVTNSIRPYGVTEYYIDVKRPGFIPTAVEEVDLNNTVIKTMTSANDISHHNTFTFGNVYWIKGWAKKPSHTVTLDKNEGSPNRAIYYWPDKGYTTSSDSKDVIGSGSVIVLSSDLPVRDGYDFAGYYSEKTGGKQYIDKDGKLTSNAGALSKEDTWFAHWTPIEYTITLNTYGASPYNDSSWTAKTPNQLYTKTYTIESNSITLPFVLLQGYYFAGWTGSNGATPATSVTVPKGSTGDKSYTASYEKIYTVTYSSAHGTPSKSSDSVYKSSLAVTLPTVTADIGYTFNGWKSSAWIGTKAGGSSFTFASAADMAVTADFTPIDYTVTLSTNGGSVSGWTAATVNSKYTKTYNIETVSFTLPTPTRTGYTFTGWTGSNGTTPQTSVTISKGTTGSKDYTANWVFGATGSITIDPNGGSAYWEYYPQGYGSAGSVLEQSGTLWGAYTCDYYSVPSWHTQSASWVSDSDMVRQLLTDKGWDGPVRLFSNPVRQGYVFAGWKAEAKEAGSAVVAKEGNVSHYALSGDVVVTAQWVPVHKVTLNRNASENDEEEVQSFYYKEGVACLYMDAACTAEVASSDIILPERAGYTFLGYAAMRSGGTIFISASLGLQNITESLVVADTIWYAQWRMGAKGSMTIDPNGGSAYWEYYPQGYGSAGSVLEQSGTLWGAYTCDYYSVPSWHTQSASWVSDSDMVRQLLTDKGWDGPVRLFSNPVRQGYVFAGWKAEASNESAAVVRSTSSVHYALVGDVKVIAQWTPAISVDVPIEVTAQVDLLGIEDQVPASGYIESRCGAPLAVEEVSFTALAGAADLFGEANTASVSLQALALEGDASWAASTPTFSFPLNANATESDASKLAALCMETYEDHIPIGYRFAIPEDVLASIDPARFEQATTPVCSVVYKIALASA